MLAFIGNVGKASLAQCFAVDVVGAVVQLTCLTTATTGSGAAASCLTVSCQQPAATLLKRSCHCTQGTVQGIDRVLLPAQAASNASEAAGAGTNSTSTAAAGRRLLGMSIMSAPHASAAHLLGDALAAGSITRGRQLLGFGSGRAKGYGGGDDSDSSTECNQGVCSGSMFYDDLQNASDAQYSGSAIDAGDEF